MSRAHSVNRGRRSRRLEIEPLEDRIVPAITPVTTDLWDVNQGNVVTANSAVVGPPIYPSAPFLSNIRNMFGNVQAGVVEPGNTLFQDFEAPGSVDFVEWQTPSAMTLRSFHLMAAHDGFGRNFNHRGFNKFTLYAQNPTTLAFVKIFEISPASLYGNTTPPSNGYLDVTPGGNNLRVSANLTPIVAQKFRAEFVQQGVGSTESGVRIVELDGFDTFDTAGPIPNVAPTANAGGPYSVPEGGSVPLNGSASSDPDGTIATYQWDLNYVAPNFDIDATGVAPSFSAAGLNGPSNRTVALRVIDNLGTSSAVATSTINITNVPPSGGADNATVTVNEGATASNTGTFSDPADPVSLSASIGTVIDTGSSTWSWSWTTSDGPDDSQTVTIFGNDGEGAVPIANFGLVVNNVAPSGAADNATVTVNEGATASNTGTYADPADPVSLTASVGAVIDTGSGTWSWSWTTSDGPDDSQTVTIFGNDGEGAVPIATFGLVVNNVAPTGAVDNATVTVNEGDAASNTGTYSDPADPVSLTASVGTVIDTGSGTWSWSWTTSDGPDDSQTVTIFGNDGEGAVPIATFGLVVNNVAPTGAVDNATVTVNESDTASNTGTYSDPADPVNLSASVGTVIDTGSGTWSWSWTTSDGPDDSQSVTIFGNDGEGAVPIATFGLIVNNVAPNGTADNATVTVNAGATANNTGTFSDPADPVTLSASVGTVIDTGGGHWNWSFNTGGAVSQTVTIFGDDGAGAVPIASFSLVINNSTTVQLHINPPQINLNGNGVFQVVALSTPAFLATSLDPATLRLSGAAPSHVALSDVDNDGDLDLVMHFRRQDFVDEYAAALCADLEDGILNSNHQEIYLSFMGTTFSGIDVTGAAWVDMFMTGKYLDNLI